MRTWTRSYISLTAITLVVSATFCLPSHADETPSAETVYQNVSGSIYEVYSISTEDKNEWTYGSAVAIEKQPTSN